MVAMQQERVRSSHSSLQQKGTGRRGASFWKEEKDSVGTRLMERMGWKEGKGLGKGERGKAEMQVKGKVKADQRGIGAAALTGEAKQNLFAQATTDMFNALLSRLNQSHPPPSSTTPTTTSDLSASTAEEEREEEEEEAVDHNHLVAAVSRAVSRRVLYSKFRKAKDSSQYSTESLQEILGGKGRKGPRDSSSSSSPSPPSSSTALPPSTPSPSSPPPSSLLTSTSSLSITDYFQTKMRAKLTASTSSTTTSASTPFHDHQQAATAHFDHLQSVSAIGRGGLGFHSGKRRTEQRPTSLWGREEDAKDERKGDGEQAQKEEAQLSLSPPRHEEEEKDGREEEESREERRRLKKEQKAKREADKRGREAMEETEDQGSVGATAVDVESRRRPKKQRTDR